MLDEFKYLEIELLAKARREQEDMPMSNLANT